MSTTSAEKIHELMDIWAEAVRAKDLATALSPYAEGVVAYDLINPLQYVGANAVRDRLADWFGQFEGSIGFEFQDLEISASDDVAFCHALNRVSATLKTGEPIDMWWRSTICWQLANDEWRIVHEHSSVPFDMETGRASMDLTPQYLTEQGGG